MHFFRVNVCCDYGVFVSWECLFLDRKEGVEIRKQGTEIGKVMAEKSKGLFSADDWQCKT